MCRGRGMYLRRPESFEVSAIEAIGDLGTDNARIRWQGFDY